MWQVESFAEIMYACIILHNMIVEDERDTFRVRYDDDYEEDYDEVNSTPLLNYGHGPIHGFSRVLEICIVVLKRIWLSIYFSALEGVKTRVI